MATPPLLLALALVPLLGDLVAEAGQTMPAADDPIYFRETVDLALEGNILLDWPASQGPERAAVTVMVCGLSGPDSFLSLRAAPDIAAQELMRLPPYANLDLTGETVENAAWAKVEGYAIKADGEGRTVANSPLASTAVTGWVSTRYLCNFTH